MSMYKCPVCGELFSTSYKKCPFCEEDDLMASDTHKRSGRHHHRRRNEPRAVGPVLIVIFLLLAALVVFLVAGDSIFGGKDPVGEDEPPVSDVIGGEEGEEGEGSGESDQTPEVETVPMVLDQTSAELEVGGRLVLTASEGTGTYTWTSSDESIAIVTEGVVDILAAGNVTITVTDGETNAVCEITVKATPLSINKSDVSISVGEKFTLKAEGGTKFTFSSDKESVATVDENGVVTGKGSGKANITVSNGSSTQSCIVRVR